MATYMQPVLPTTTVLGPAAFIIRRITNADSQPWQVLCPEVNISSRGMFLTPFTWGRSAINSHKLPPYSYPVIFLLHLTCIQGFEHDIRHVGHIRPPNLSSA